MSTFILCLEAPAILDEVADRALACLRRHVPEAKSLTRAPRYIPVHVIGSGAIPHLKEKLRSAVGSGVLRPVRATCAGLAIDHATAVLEIDGLEATLEALMACVPNAPLFVEMGRAALPIVELRAPDLHPKVRTAFASMTVPKVGDTVARVSILEIDGMGEAVPVFHINLGTVESDAALDESLAA